MSLPPPAAKMIPGSPSLSADTLTDTDTLNDGKHNEKYTCKAMSFSVSESEKPIDIEAQITEPKEKPLAGLRYTLFTLYRRLFTIVFLANVAVFVAVMTSNRRLLALVNATAANLLVCGLARQPLVVNSMFVVVCSIPRSAPLALRRWAAKVYHYGGVHSSCGVASLVWFLGFVGLMSYQYWTPSVTIGISATPVALSYIILVLLMAIIVVAHPTFRMKKHDYFELTHRFSGWLVVVLFFVLLMVFSKEISKSQQEPLGYFLIKLPAFWFLIITVVAIIHPWLLLRKVLVKSEVLSSHAIRLHFDHAATTFGKGTQLAKNPLRDWHAFATFPDPAPSAMHGKPSFSCIVSKAGNWTSDTIQNPPTHLWKRGVLLYGFAYAMRVFKKVIVVTTGSGIGPCLSFLGDDNRPALRVLWQTRNPYKTYGGEVINLLSRLDPDPIILDTEQTGRLDMVPLIRRQIEEFDAEAVCVISNPMLTRKIVYELEARGVPAFGPIFDS
ncbi:Integral membrane protein TmpA [Penicillium taxi]|uniref:Integral membrane protein TmpA n=1 Tax=Penicillium taxi TaxID=168475 RepID=UPI0025450D79|nr:Integral membrane protein TmpA [Penicillium taxi]KAJ5893444.1 Integral membrane protein TmpA [Penicillium taxi]